VPIGFYGVFLAMFFLELVRLTVEIAAWSMNRPLYTLFRMTVITVLATLGVGVTNAVITQGLVVYAKDQSVFQPLVSMVTELNATALSYLTLPFVPFVDVVLADGLTGPHLLRAALLTGVVIVLMLGIVLFYAATRSQLVRREQEIYNPETTSNRIASVRHDQSASSKQSLAIRILERAGSRCGGMGALSWRQFLGAKRHGGGVLTALIAPAVFACIPLFVMANSTLAFLATAGALAFYSFILLPTALRFDFHRDLNRLAILKGLPIGTMATVVGQVVAPATIALLFQLVVLTVACVARGMSPQFLLATTMILIPTNVLIFALENLIYLLYPYRIQQEGLEVFLRTMLTFTGKGLLFTFGLVAISMWGFQAASLAARLQHWTDTPVHPGLVFTAGLIAILWAFATLTLAMLSRTYEQLDPIEDLPR
jgi:hypothetical protein